MDKGAGPVAEIKKLAYICEIMPCGDILLNMRKSGFGIGLVSIILSMVLPLANATEIRAWTADELDGCNFGLTFRSHKYPLDERTGLNLTPDRHLT